MRRAWLDRLDHEIGQQSSYASMNTLGYVKFFRGRVQIERPQIDPKLHDAKSIEQRHFLLQCNPRMFSAYVPRAIIDSVHGPYCALIKTTCKARYQATGSPNPAIPLSLMNLWDGL